MSRTDIAPARASFRYREVPWKWMFGHAFHEFFVDDIPGVAAGATFYVLLAFFPALVAFVSLYGLFADVQTASEHLAYLRGFLPRDVLKFMGEEMIRVALTHPSKLSGAFILSLVISIWSANAGISSLISGLNVAYEQKETRSLVHIHLRSLAITVGALVAGIAALIIVVAVPVVQSFIGVGGFDLLELLRWPLLFAGSTAVIGVLYRYGPNCKRGGRRRVLFGAMFASAVWVAVSLGFSWYLSDVANYDRTYGSLGSLMGFMMWVWLGLMVILFGAELNSELERISGR